MYVYTVHCLFDLFIYAYLKKYIMFTFMNKNYCFHTTLLFI